MVSKITLFEPHFDGAQIGPASLGTEGTDLELGESAREHDSATREPTASSRPPRARLLGGVAGVTVGLLAGLLAWRRVKGGSKAESVTGSESADEPRIEERPVGNLTGE
ncbi:MAG: hypothetical protein ABEJ84_03770 [Halodesulfurarchaeum sp.]